MFFCPAELQQLSSCLCFGNTVCLLRLKSVCYPLQAYQNGIRRCMNSIPLWRSSAKLEEKAGAVGRARAILEQARLKNSKNAEIWLAAVRTEQRAGNTKAAESLMAKALQV